MTKDGGVLVVDDEFLIVELLSMMLEEMGMEMCASAASAASADEAVAMAVAHSPRLVLMDVRLKGQKDGIDAAVAIWRATPTPIIFITGSREPATVDRIRKCHPTTILFKPIGFDQLKLAVMQAMA